MTIHNKDDRFRYLLKCFIPYAPERIYLFGSWAWGEADELSDLDIVIIKRTYLPFLDRTREVLSLLPQELGGSGCVVYMPEDWTRIKEMGNAFVEMVMEEGKLIYGRETRRKARRISLNRRKIRLRVAKSLKILL